MISRDPCSTVFIYIHKYVWAVGFFFRKEKCISVFTGGYLQAKKYCHYWFGISLNIFIEVREMPKKRNLSRIEPL